MDELKACIIEALVDDAKNVSPEAHPCSNYDTFEECVMVHRSGKECVVSLSFNDKINSTRMVQVRFPESQMEFYREMFG